MSVLDDLDAPLQSALSSAERATDAYIRTLVDSAWRDLTPHFQESRLYLKFLPRTHPQAGSTFARPDGQISVGAKDLSELHQSTLVISEYLAKNFSVVNSAGLGENLPPSKLVALEEFPTAAI